MKSALCNFSHSAYYLRFIHSVAFRTPGKQIGIEVVIVRAEALNPGLVVAYLVLNYLV